MSHGHEKGLPGWRWWLTAIVAVGVFLRLWKWQSQILIDDEWHALHFVIERTFLEVLYQHGLGANCIPYNIYCWLTLHTIGWSEPIIRFPSLCAGMLAMVILPLQVRRLWGDYVAIITAALIAISPVLIFYSRISRPYSALALFASASVLLTFCWIKEGQRRDVVLAALCGSIAISFHLYASIPVMAAPIIAGMVTLFPAASRLGMPHGSTRPIRDLLIFVGIIIVTAGPLAVLPNILYPWWRVECNINRATIETILTVARLLTGSYRIELVIVSVALIISGMLLVVKQNRMLGLSFAVPFISYALLMTVRAPVVVYGGIIIVRYGIAFFTIAFIAIAIAIVEGGQLIGLRFPIARRPYFSVLLVVALMISLMIFSPLWWIYDGANNFTSHSAFQHHYERRDWSQKSPERELDPGYYMNYKAIPGFYFYEAQLKRYKGLVEFPMMLGDNINVLFYFQHFHKLPVVAGFDSTLNIKITDSRRPAIHPANSIDYVMGNVPTELKTQIKWRNMVDLSNMAALKEKYQRWLVVVHHYPLRENLMGDDKPNFSDAEQVADNLTGVFGSPVYSDGQMAAWEIR